MTASGYGTSYATLETFTRDSTGGWHRAFAPMPARIGWAGFAAPGGKREGDGRSPTGKFSFGRFLWGRYANPGVHYSYRHVGSPTYNTWQYYNGLNPPFAKGSEKWWQVSPQYNYAATITYNTNPVVQGAGSGIFLHVNGSGSTAGCISLSTGNLVNVLKWLNPAKTPFIAMGTGATILR